MTGTTGWENGTLIAKNITFDYTATPPRAGVFTADGQLLIGSTANPNICATVGTLTAGTGIQIDNTPGNIKITATGGGGSGATSFVTDVPGPIAPTGAGVVTVTGSNVYTDGGTANTIKYNLQGTAHTIYVNQGLLTPATTIGPLTNGQLIIGSTGVDPVAATLASSDSSITITNGGGAIDLKVAGGTTVGKTITGDTGGALPPTAGNWNIIGGTVAAGTSPLKTAGASSTLTINAQRSQAIVASDATKIGLCNFNSAQFTVDANGFVSAAASGIPTTITGDSGGALSPSSNNWNILGRSGSKTSGSGATLTVKSPPYSQVGGAGTSALNTGEFVTAAVTRTLPVSAGLADGDLFKFQVTSAATLIIQAVGSQVIRIGSAASSAAGTANSNAIGDQLSLRFDATNEIFYDESVQGTWTLL